MIEDAVFILLCGITVTGAILAVGLPNVYHNALAMGFSFTGLAGLYLYLNSEFLAAMQVIIYVGAISIAIIFAIMLSQPAWKKVSRSSPLRMSLSLVLAAGFLFAVVKMILTAAWPEPGPSGEAYSAGEIGRMLLGRYVVPFEIVSLILLIVIIGALLITEKTEAK